MQSDELKRRISAGRGDALADLVLENARIVNVFTDEIDTADIAISGHGVVTDGAILVIAIRYVLGLPLFNHRRIYSGIRYIIRP